MSKKRVHELAKEVGLENREAVLALQAAGIQVKTHSSSVYEEEALAVLNKFKKPETQAAGRRPGMMIVKKRREAEGTGESGAAQASDSEVAASSTDVATQPSVAPQAPEAAKAVSGPAPSEALAAQAPATEHKAETPAPKPSVKREQPAVTGAQATPSESAPRPSMPPRIIERNMMAPPAERPAAQATTPGAPPKPGTEPPRPARPGQATVVRMIDRDKLLERVPGRRLGNNGPGGGQRFGQVTELKVVTDPFGRGREIVQVGRDKRGRPGVGPAGVAGRNPGPVRKGRGGRRDMNDMRERSMYPSRLKKKKAGKGAARAMPATQPRASKRVIKMKEQIIVADLAHQLGVKSTDIIRRLMAMGTMVTQNQTIDFDTTQLIAQEFEFTVDSVAFAEAEVLAAGQAPEVAGDQVTRPPVVTVMGHVDHGKTSLLDAIRKARVASGEAGGITQHIGAYEVPVEGRGTVTFLDTPGHAAFTSMRARGAQVTDIVVLVVAADDGVMPQTEEAVRHAQAAKVPIIVAVNKIDRPDANADRVMQELAKFDLVPEAWGGETLFVNTSATKGTGISELLDAILLQAEVAELTANPDRSAEGVVIEAQLDKGRGPVATVLVQQGTLKRGDAIVVGTAFGRIRAMMDATGKQLQEAGPSSAVEVTGLDIVPNAGDPLHVAETSEAARLVAEHRQQGRRSAEAGPGQALSLDDLMRRIEGAEVMELKVVLKADVQGSVEAVKGALLKLSTDEVKVNVIYSAAGGIKESDVLLASASRGLVLGFGVRPDGNARSLADREGVEVRTYSIIYEAIDDIQKAMEGLLTPESREKVVGRAEVRELFRVTKVGTIGGSRVLDGKAMRSAKVRVVRNNVQIYEGKVASLRHFKSDVREVESGLECGIGVEGYNDLKLGDVIEFFQVEEVARTLGAPTHSAGRRSAAATGDARA